MDGKKKVVKTISLADGKPWLCENGHLLGIMRRERIARGRGKGYRLYLLRNAEEQMPDEYAPLAWIGRLEGTMRNIQCSCCAEEKTWWANKAAMDQLQNSHMAMHNRKDDEGGVRVVPVVIQSEGLIRR